MLKKHDIRGRDNGELHRKHVTIRGHPGRWNDLIPEGDDVLNGLTIHQVRGAFNFDHSFVGADGVVVVLEVEAVGDIGTVLKEDIANRAVDDVVHGRVLSRG
jgi:hypothetical protein